MASSRFHTALLLAPEPLLRRTVRQALLALGVPRVLEAGTGAEALTRLGSELVQLVLTPWEAPDMAGRSLVQSLRNHGRNREVPVVVLDAGLSSAQVVAAVKAGAAGRLPLPVQRGALAELLERLAAEAPSADPAPQAPTAEAPRRPRSRS